nr:helix-turn-helix domain-containing protein [Streptococcus hyovaginalis]
MAKGKYKEWLTNEKLDIVAGWAQDGLTNNDIAYNIGINPDTLYTWIKKYPEFSEALKVNKEVADRRVENALYKSAIGFTYEEETVTNQGEVVTVKKYSKPNTTAQIFWLKNRKQEWSDRQEIEHTGTVVFANEDNIPD